MEANVLITSVSKKVWLVEAFKDALGQATSVSGKVVSVDSDPLSAGFYKSDKHCIVPYSDEFDFIPEILSICKKEKIKLIVPTRDGELLVFAKNKPRFKKQGIEVMVSDPEIIEICNDKYRLYRFLIEQNLSTPQTFLKEQINLCSSYPLLIKSRVGSGGKQIFKAENEKELEFFVNYIDNPIIQEFVKGKEYTVDLFSDFNKKVLTVLPRERIETFSGESYKAKTVNDEQIISLAKNTVERLGTIGHITLQFIKNGNSLKLIEINPRFGGGAMLGIESGHNTPLLLIKLIAGENIKPQIGNFKENLVMLRYTKDFFVGGDKLIK